MAVLRAIYHVPRSSQDQHDGVSIFLTLAILPNTLLPLMVRTTGLQNNTPLLPPSQTGKPLPF